MAYDGYDEERIADVMKRKPLPPSDKSAGDRSRYSAWEAVIKRKLYRNKMCIGDD